MTTERSVHQKGRDDLPTNKLTNEKRMSEAGKKRGESPKGLRLTTTEGKRPKKYGRPEQSFENRSEKTQKRNKQDSPEA